jgi:prepilin-type N-terminal cleavage/methylation domain-containing protein
MSAEQAESKEIKKYSGFTLIELLVAVSLMVFLISIVAYIFRSATSVYRQNEDLINLSNNARVILEFLQRDLVGTLSPSTTSRQCFRMVNGGRNNYTDAKDQFIFNSITTVLGQTRPVRVRYRIVESLKPRTKEQRKTVITNTLLWKFERYVTELDGSKILTADGKELPAETLSEYLAFFNIHYYAYEQPTAEKPRFFELDEPPGYDENGNSYADMLSQNIEDGGNNNCIGDGVVTGAGPEEPKLTWSLEFYYQIYPNEKETVQKIYYQKITIPAR